MAQSSNDDSDDRNSLERVAKAAAQKCGNFDTQVELAIEHSQEICAKYLDKYPNLSPSQRATVAATFVETLSANRNALLSAHADMWAAHFTSDELVVIAGFYGSPVGDKFRDLTETVEQAERQAFENWYSTNLRHAVERLRQDGVIPAADVD